MATICKKLAMATVVHY